MLTKPLILFFLTLFLQVSYSQEEVVPRVENEQVSVYSLNGVEKSPEYPGGVREFYKYIAKSFKTPSDKSFKGGKVFISFVIEIDGSLTDFKVLKSPGFGTGEEAQRVLENCEKWIPAEQNGEKVRCQYTLPITIASN